MAGKLVDPLYSKDGTPAKIEKKHDDGHVLTTDEAVLEQLTGIHLCLQKILRTLEFEFEQETEEVDES